MNLSATSRQQVPVSRECTREPISGTLTILILCSIVYFMDTYPFSKRNQSDAQPADNGDRHELSAEELDALVASNNAFMDQTRREAAEELGLPPETSMFVINETRRLREEAPGSTPGVLDEPSLIEQTEEELGLPRGFMPAGLLPRMLQEHNDGLKTLRQILAEQVAEKEGVPVEQVLEEIANSSQK